MPPVSRGLKRRWRAPRSATGCRPLRLLRPRPSSRLPLTSTATRTIGGIWLESSLNERWPMPLQIWRQDNE